MSVDLSLGQTAPAGASSVRIRTVLGCDRRIGRLMRVIVKTSRICIQIRGIIPGALLDVLRQEYGKRLLVRSERGERMQDVLNASLYEQEPNEMNAGAYPRFFRQDKDLTQAELGRKLGGVSRQHVCDMENGRRPISRMMALRLSGLFEVSPGKFVG